MGKRSIAAGSYVGGPSTCGQNCTYALTFQGPTLACNNITSYQNLSLDAISYDYTVQGGDYRAAGALANENFNFEVHYYEGVGLDRQFDPQLFLTCFLRKADYHVNVTYNAGIPTFDFQVNNSQPINSTSLLKEGTSSNSSDPQPGIPDANNMAAIDNLNVWALYQAMVIAMTGDIGRYGLLPSWPLILCDLRSL